MDRRSATTPPGRMPSSTAARVACIASSTRCLRSFTSTSVAPPTLIYALPPDLLARRYLRHVLPAGDRVQELLELLAILLGGGLLNLRLDLRDTGLNVSLLASA